MAAAIPLLATVEGEDKCGRVDGQTESERQSFDILSVKKETEPSASEMPAVDQVGLTCGRCGSPQCDQQPAR